jgi:predicted negative regulator of RcsB-dependent stress response
LYLSRGDAYGAKKDKGRAVADYNTALEIDQTSFDLRVRVAQKLQKFFGQE